MAAKGNGKDASGKDRPTNIARGPTRKGRAAKGASAKSPAKKAASSKKGSGSSSTARPKAKATPRKRAREASSTASSQGATSKAAAAGAWLRAEAITWSVGIALGLALAVGLMIVQARRDVRAWIAAPPARPPTVLWSAPITLRPGERYPREELVQDLVAGGLERAPELRRPGEVSLDGDAIVAWLPEPLEPGAWRPGKVRVKIEGDVIASLSPGEPLRLPPTRLAELGDLDARRDPADLARLPAHLPTALLAIEDARFREHIGIDPIGILRALASNLTSDGLQGGSTLTQQLAKNVFLSRERTWRRKVREVFYAIALELELDKQQLLARYLSEVYLGHVGGRPLHGVEQAARAWFGRSAEHLTLAQSATIVGAIASPNVYSPLRDHTESLRRRNLVLQRMVDIGALTRAEADAAHDEPLTTIPTPLTASWRLPWGVDAALWALDEALGDDGRDGLQVHTTIQPHWQRAAQRAVEAAMADLAAAHPEASDAEVALVAMDSRTGDVRAVIGGRDYHERPFPRATRGRRQAGSTVKPLTLLGALSADPSLSPATLVQDAPLTIRTDSGSWSPSNVDRTFLGALPLRDAISRSRNLPAVRLAQGLGWTRVRDLFHKAGLSGATALPSVSLGAFEVTAWEMAGAYTVFPGEGQAVRPRLLDRVLDAAGTARVDTRPRRERVADPVSAALATAILQSVITDGTGRRVSDAGLRGPLGGKTGTTDDGRDAWFVGFDGSTTVAVWVGRDKGEPLGLGGGQAAAPVFIRFATLVGLPRTRLPGASGIETAEVCVATGRPPCPGCDQVVTELFRAGQVPQGTGPCGSITPALPAIPDDDPAAEAVPTVRRPFGRKRELAPSQLPDNPDDL